MEETLQDKQKHIPGPFQSMAGLEKFRHKLMTKPKTLESCLPNINSRLTSWKTNQAQPPSM